MCSSILSLFKHGLFTDVHVTVYTTTSKCRVQVGYVNVYT